MAGKVDFQRRHFQFLADFIQTVRTWASSGVSSITPDVLAMMLVEEFESAQVNRNFDRHRFLIACGCTEQAAQDFVDSLG